MVRELFVMLMGLKPVVKIFVVLALTAIIITFMILTARADLFDDLFKILFTS